MNNAMPTHRAPLDELRKRERVILDMARRGDPVAPSLVVALCRSLAHARQQLRDERYADPGRALVEAYRELSEGFALLVQERRELDAQLASLRKKRAGETTRRPRKPPLTHDMVDEMRRLREERDDARQAARDADGRYLALYRQLESSAR
jgi:chromosome segregation ATPase